MRLTWKKVVAVAVTAVCICGAVAYTNLSAQGILPDSAVARTKESNAGGKVYIDDGAIALAGSLSEEDPSLTKAAQDAFTQVNALRAAQGLPAYTWNDDLAQAAYVRAQEIVGTFSHTRPDGSNWWTVNSNIMYGENLAKNYSTATDVVNAWMASPTHKANVMDAGFKTLGIAVFQGSDGHWYWAQEFGY